jgi:osmotically-inducible protein OsmY
MSLEEQRRYLAEDPDVEKDVRDEVGNLGFSRRGFIGLAVDHGVVELTGFTDSYAQKWEIERAASRVIGVRDVRDYLEVRPAEAGQRADSLIALAARCALEWDARVPPTVEVEVTDGALRLHGTVERFAQRDAAEEAVRNLVGVRDLSTEIKVAPSEPAADVAGGVESALRRRFGLLCRHVWLVERDGVVTVSGTVATFELVTEVERVVNSVPGVVRVDNRVLVA